MSKVDDELTRRLRRAERPVDADDLFESLERRRSHRERARKVQAGMLAFAVLAATAGGFAVLREAFQPDDRGPAVSPSPNTLSANGEIVFVKDGDDSRLHIYAAQPDGSGERQITEGPTNDSNPAVSPDGQRVAFVRILDERTQRVAIVGIDGGEVTQLTAEYNRAADPAWSPSGTTLAYVTTGIDSLQLATIDVETGQIHYLVDFFGQLANPTWSPDGTRIALAIRSQSGSSDLAITHADGSDLERVVATNDLDEVAPAWSPDGTQIAFIRPGKEAAIWTVDPDDGSETLVARASGISLGTDLAWAPDGSALLASDGQWIYRIDVIPQGDPGDHVRLMKGNSPSWQPLPAGSDPSPTPEPEPSISADPEPAGRDIGIGFNLCSIERLGGVDWFGDGIEGAAWTGTRVDDRGRCGRASTDSLVAGDLDGDGTADTWSNMDECILCEPWAAAVLDGNGTEELVVMLFADIQPTFAFYFAVPDQRPRDSGIYPIFLEDPGAPELGLRPEGFVTVQAGAGEEGTSANAIRCEGYPEDPALVVATWIKDAGTGAIEYHGARLKLEMSDDRLAAHFVVVDTFTPTATSEDFGGDGKACGVDFNPWS